MLRYNSPGSFSIPEFTTLYLTVLSHNKTPKIGTNKRKYYSNEEPRRSPTNEKNCHLPYARLRAQTVVITQVHLSNQWFPALLFGSYRYQHSPRSIITQNGTERGSLPELPRSNDQSLSLRADRGENSIFWTKGGNHGTLGTKIAHHLTLHSKFGPSTVLVDHDKEDHQKDAGKSSKSNCYGHLLEAKHRQSGAVTGSHKHSKVMHVPNENKPVTAE